MVALIIPPWPPRRVLRVALSIPESGAEYSLAPSQSLLQSQEMNLHLKFDRQKYVKVVQYKKSVLKFRNFLYFELYNIGDSVSLLDSLSQYWRVCLSFNVLFKYILHFI